MKVKSIIKRIEADTQDASLTLTDLVPEVKGLREDMPALAAELDASLSAKLDALETSITNLKNIAYAHAGVAEGHAKEQQQRLASLHDQGQQILRALGTLTARQERVADREAEWHSESVRARVALTERFDRIEARITAFVEGVARGQAAKEEQLAGLLELEQKRHDELLGAIERGITNAMVSENTLMGRLARIEQQLAVSFKLFRS